MVPISLAPAHRLETLLAPYELRQRIGSRPSPLYVVRHAAPGAKPKLLVAERFAGVANPTDEQWAMFMAEARRMSTLASSNVARVRELAVRGDDLVVFWDFIDGEKLIETWLSAGMPLEVSLRILLDVLSGLGAIHGLRDAKQEPMDLAHGELSTATIVVGLDGAARVLHAIARRMPGARAEAASLGYLAPEVHAGEAYGACADVFSAGVLLWEALSGTRLFPEGDPVAILACLRDGGVPPPAVPSEVSWARQLIAVAAKALAPSPEDRWPSVASMAAEIRKVVGLKLASAAAAAAFAKTVMGERVRARRQTLESGVDPVAATMPAETLSVSLIPEAIDEALVLSEPPPPLPESVPPPSLPTATVAPQAAGDDTGAAPDFAAAIDVPISIAPPPTDPFEVSPTSVETTGSFERDAGAARRRRVAVLGGVGALGLIVFALAGWRAAHRDPGLPASDQSRAGAAAVSRPVRPPVAPTLARATISAASPAPSVNAVPPAPATAVAASRAPRSPPPASSPAAPKPSSSVAAAPAKAPATPQARPKPKSNSGYDPGAL